MRYERQLKIFGAEGQKKIECAHVAVAGCGGLGCNVITELALAGVGKMTVIDSDYISETNLNRQFIHCGHGGSKTDSVKEWLMKISNCDVKAINAELTAENVLDFISDADIVVDCLDNNRSRIILNDGIIKKNVPLVHGGVNSTFGQVTFIIPGKTPCLSCILGKDSDDHSSVSPAVATIASIQAMEVLKYITGKGELLTGKLLTMDLNTDRFETIEIKKNVSCDSCSEL